MNKSLSAIPSSDTVSWPIKYTLFGVNVSATTYDEAEELVIRAAKQGLAATVDHMPVHGLIEASRDPSLQQKINSLDMVAPDGQPVRWALNWLFGANLRERVYGPELMKRLCSRAPEEGVGVYLYGSTPETVERLKTNLEHANPGLRVVGCESPPFRELTPDEDKETVERINRSGAGLVFLGLGCPKQEIFAYEHRHRINAVQLCVGAAFDFLAGEKKMAPKWMQERGLEWLFRLVSEPRRLYRRYLGTNAGFLLKCAREKIRFNRPSDSRGPFAPKQATNSKRSAK